MTDASDELDEFALTLENAEGKKKQILFEAPKIIITMQFKLNWKILQIQLTIIKNLSFRLKTQQKR